ncbi:hypothetical protein GCM10010988_41610 [Cnuibacter physcomitrellae]|nr:hypothetical protein GCM10010988_41610 [Cnuibacter physcomitrellae]
MVGVEDRADQRPAVAVRGTEGAFDEFGTLIGRDFSVGDPGRCYVGDITYLPIADGTNLYLASCIDLGSRKLAGWQVADHMRRRAHHGIHRRR